MLGRIVKCDRAIEMNSPFRDISGMHQGQAHGAMPDHERDGRLMLLRKRQELRSEVAQHITIEGHDVRDPETVEDGEQRQWIFGRFSQRFGLFDQQTTHASALMAKRWEQAALTAAGAEKIFAEKVSGAVTDRKTLARAIASLGVGDVLLVTRLDRPARSTRDPAWEIDADCPWRTG